MRGRPYGNELMHSVEGQTLCYPPLTRHDLNWLCRSGASQIKDGWGPNLVRLDQLYPWDQSEVALEPKTAEMHNTT